MTKKKILLILIPVLLTIIGVLSYLVFFNKEEPSDKKEKIVKKHNSTPVYYALDKFTVNLTDANRVFLQTTILIEVNDEKQSEVFKQYTPNIRNRLIHFLCGKTKEELMTIEGKLKLQKDIQKLMEEPFGQEEHGQEIKEVLFTQFIIQ